MAEKFAAPECDDWQAAERRYVAAREKARDVNFTTAGNPLAHITPEEAANRGRFERNMDALRADARRRESPATGQVYAGIMNMRFGG